MHPRQDAGRNIDGPTAGSRLEYQQQGKEPLYPAVTRTTWIEGRTSEITGRPYLPVRGDDGALLEVDQMHTDFTDQQLARDTDPMEPIIESIEGRDAAVRPEIVLKIECAEIKELPTYDVGYGGRYPPIAAHSRRARADGCGRIDRFEAVSDQQ